MTTLTPWADEERLRVLAGEARDRFRAARHARTLLNPDDVCYQPVDATLYSFAAFEARIARRLRHRLFDVRSEMRVPA